MYALQPIYIMYVWIVWVWMVYEKKKYTGAAYNEIAVFLFKPSLFAAFIWLHCCTQLQAARARHRWEYEKSNNHAVRECVCVSYYKSTWECMCALCGRMLDEKKSEYIYQRKVECFSFFLFLYSRIYLSIYLFIHVQHPYICAQQAYRVPYLNFFHLICFTMTRIHFKKILKRPHYESKRFGVLIFICFFCKGSLLSTFSKTYS